MAYSKLKTTQKATGVATTVTVFTVAAILITAKIEPILVTNGMDIDPVILVGCITGVLQGAFTAASNFFKHRKKK